MKSKRKTIIVNFVAKHSYLFVLNMIKGFVDDGCRVIAIVSKNMPEINQWRAVDNLTVFPVDGYSTGLDYFPKLIKYFLFDAPKIKKIAKEYEADIIYLPILTYWSYFINKSLGNIKYIYMMHDPIPHDKGFSPLNVMNLSLGRNAYKLIILSETFLQYTLQRYKKNRKDILIIPSGSENTSTGFKKTLVDYDDQKTNFLFQGRVDSYKGLHVLAKAYSKLYKEYNNITLTIAGSGDFSSYKEEYAELPNCTVINRWLTNEEVSGLFNDKSVITVLPYLSATQSGVINVAMPSGSPIIATRCGGIVEQIEDGVTGYLIDPNDEEALYNKMKYVINHKDELKNIRLNAYNRMKNLSWNKLAQKIIDAI